MNNYNRSRFSQVAYFSLLVDLWLGRELNLSSVQYSVLLQYAGLGEVMAKWLGQRGTRRLEVCPSL